MVRHRHDRCGFARLGCTTDASLARDVQPLMVFNDGDTKYLDDIIWEWAFTPFQRHWGIHAIQAINALHWIVFDHGIPDASGK